MKPQLDGGWLVYPCDAEDTARVQIAVGDDIPKLAFRDRHDGHRVAKIRPPAELLPGCCVRVRLLVNGTHVASDMV